MKTPITDFVKNYIKSSPVRFHMPGHKGQNFLGVEKYDITEIRGADCLCVADGIIKESEEIASSLFSSSHTYYTTQGCSAAIFAMLSIVCKEKSLVLAARNAHKSFIHACALLDLEVDWLMSDNFSHIAKCEITADDVEKKIIKSHKKPSAVYLTSPDYLGNILDIKKISEVCKKYNIPLLVDNAHGAYLAFLKKSLHPIHNGADICCDSAHKTLPVLTGGAYLHFSKKGGENFNENARDKLALFSSTSPSYLVLQSLDLCNAYLAENYTKKLEDCIKRINETKAFITSKGFALLTSEPLKIVFDAKLSGYTGKELAAFLQKNNIEPEFCDEDFLVLMITPENSFKDFDRLKSVIEKIPLKKEIAKKNIGFMKTPTSKMSIRDAVFSEPETIDINSALGRVCAAPVVSCPPAVPIVISGEEITSESIELFKAYGIEKIKVIKNS